MPAAAGDREVTVNLGWPLLFQTKAANEDTWVGSGLMRSWPRVTLAGVWGESSFHPGPGWGILSCGTEGAGIEAEARLLPVDPIRGPEL